MLKSIFVSFILIISFDLFAGNPDDGVIQVPTLTSAPKRWTHNPYGASVIAGTLTPETAPSVTIVYGRNPRSTQHTGQIVNYGAETVSSEVITDGTQGDLLYRINQEIERLGNTACSAELVNDYIDLISYCKRISQDPSQPQNIKLGLQNATAYALLGLSNIYGKMRDNKNKFKTAKEAFLLYVDLHQVNPTLPANDRTPQYRAGTCLFAMNQAVYYMFVFCSDVAQNAYDESCGLIQEYAKDSVSKNDLLQRFGYAVNIQSPLSKIELKTHST